MFMYYREVFPSLHVLWDKYTGWQEQLELPARHLLIREGQMARDYYFIEKGAVRAYLTTEAGEEKTVQFFFEGDGLSSFESFIKEVPGAFNVETLEPTTLSYLSKEKVNRMFEELKKSPDFLKMMIHIFSERQIHYMHEFVSFVRDTPTRRYENLLRDRPYLLQRVPQRYIASYLGISAVHLSRIKARLSGRI